MRLFPTFTTTGVVWNFVHRFNQSYYYERFSTQTPTFLLKTVAAVKRAGRRVAPDVTPTITSGILDPGGHPRNAPRAYAGTLALA